MKRFLLLLFSLTTIFSFFALSSEAYAQGTYRCKVVGATCVFDISNCQTGYLSAGGPSCANMSLDPASGNYCATTPAQCTPDPSFGGFGESCRSGGVCDAPYVCTGGTCNTSNTPPPAPPGGGGSKKVGVPGTISGKCGGFGEYIDTAIGCIPIGDTNDLVGFFLRWGLGLAGGIAVLMIIFAGFKITTSSGDPKRLQAGQELLTSAISGVILLAFSIFILQIVGINILGINL